MTPKGLLLETEMTSPHFYEIRPREDKRGVDLVPDVLPFGMVWRALRDQQRNQSRKVFQPLTRCRDSRLRWRAT
jgi:hypothetical protein